MIDPSRHRSFPVERHNFIVNVDLFEWADSSEHYRSNRIRTKIMFSTASMGDLSDRGKGMMATNRIAPLLFNRYPDRRMAR